MDRTPPTSNNPPLPPPVPSALARTPVRPSRVIRGGRPRGARRGGDLDEGGSARAARAAHRVTVVVSRRRRSNRAWRRRRWRLSRVGGTGARRRARPYCRLGPSVGQRARDGPQGRARGRGRVGAGRSRTGPESKGALPRTHGQTPRTLGRTPDLPNPRLPSRPPTLFGGPTSSVCPGPRGRTDPGVSAAVSGPYLTRPVLQQVLHCCYFELSRKMHDPCRVVSRNEFAGLKRVSRRDTPPRERQG